MTRRSRVLQLMQHAFLLRAVVALVLHFATDDELFAPDQTLYDLWSGRLARYWSGVDLLMPWYFTTRGPKGYFYIVASLYFMLGQFALFPKLMNAFVGSLAVPIVYDLAIRVSGSEAVADRTARYTAYFPSLVLWSALNIRDCWVLVFVLLLAREGTRLQESFNLNSLVFLAIAFVGIAQFRDYMVYMIAVPIMVSFLVRRSANVGRNLVLAAIAAAFIGALDQTAAGGGSRDQVLDLEKLNSLRQWSSSSAQSGFARDVDISTPGRALAFLPIGITYFLLAPFPWMISGFRQIVTLPEMLFLYSLMPHLYRGVRHLVRERLGPSLLLLLLTTSVTCGYAIGQGNVGTIYRHRAQVLPFFLFLAAVGVEQAEALRRRRTTEAPPPGLAVPARLAG